MLDDSRPDRDAASDPLTVRPRLASIEPARPRRGDGAIHECKGLGRLEYVRMPSGRPSFWHGLQPMPGSPFGLTIVCEVEDDDPPGADHAAAVAATLRCQHQDALAVLGRIQDRLDQMRMGQKVSARDLVLSGIHLPAKPMISARHRLDYRLRTHPKLLFMVVFQHGRPTQVHVDRDH